MLTGIRRKRSGQAIVIMALAMVAICGMLALAIDAGRLYFQRRLMQDAVDAGALAGAQDLVGTTSSPNGSPSNALYHGQQDSFSVFGLSAIGMPSDAVYQQPSVTQTQGGYTVTTVAPSGYNNKQVQVSVSYNATGTFAQILGFNSINIQATATAEAGTNAKTYALFATAGRGSGNTIYDDQSGWAQIDNGQEATDACNAASSGLTISNAKLHIPNPNRDGLNVNGQIVINQGSDNHGLYQYWEQGNSWGTGVDAIPDYAMPDVSSVSPLNPGRTKINNLGGGQTATVAGVTIRNSTATNRDFYVYQPGKYTNTIQIPSNGGGDAASSMYVFLNGIYYFTGGASLQIQGGFVANTSTGLPHYVGGQGASDLPAATDGTDGIEFIFDGASAFSADNSRLPNDGSVFFVAPSFVPTGSVHIAFYIAKTNTASTGWSNQNFSASASNTPRFQVWGTVFDASGGATTLQAVQLGPHNLNPTDADSSRQYAINGEFISATISLYHGSVLGNTQGPAWSPASCPALPAPGTPALLVQFNKNFAPAPGVNSFLVK
ncbi:MAG: pilus assembly protein [Candidatus Dormibacteraeota bacterium]|nr:pilus assembly protein [Candidatus Dormibacteraeota bacterium]